MSSWLPWIAFGAYVLWTEARLHRYRATVADLRERLSRYAPVLLLLAPGEAAAFPFGPPRPRAFVQTPQHPDAAITAIIVWLYDRSKPEEQAAYAKDGTIPPWWQYYEWFHFLYTPAEDLDDEVGKFKVTVAQLNGFGPVVPRPVPVDAAGRVWAVDLREVGWSRAALREVARLDFTCREPHVQHRLAEELRRIAGVTLDPKTLAVEALLPGPWFVRQAEETDLQAATGAESIVYYNLLYSRERFGDGGHGSEFAEPEPKKPAGKPWPGGVYPVDGKNYPRGAFDVVPQEQLDAFDKAHKAWEERRDDARKAARGDRSMADADKVRADGFIDRNFPRDAKDFQKRWGGKATQDFLKDQRTFRQWGAIVAGAENDPRSGSTVAANDRAIRIQETPFGYGADTNDFLTTAGKGNLVTRVFQTAVDDLDEDASEKIYRKQDDFPAYWINGAKAAGSKRVESGDPHVVYDKINGGKPIVQVPGRCNACHYPSDVVLAPSNHKLLKSFQKRNEFLTFSKDRQLVIDAFYWDGDAVGQGWAWRMEGWRKPFARSLTLATKTVKSPKGWTGTEFAAIVNARREWYDSPVTLDEAAAELGYPRLAVVAAATQLCTVESVKLYGDQTFDAATLLLDVDDPGVPRRAFDLDLFLPLATVLALIRDYENPDPAFGMMFPDLLRGKDDPTPHAPKAKPAGPVGERSREVPEGTEYHLPF